MKNRPPEKQYKERSKGKDGWQRNDNKRREYE